MRLARWWFALSLIALASPSWSQATRTWVSGVGDDANPCSRTAPCKTFAGAISKTATAGEINVLDPGGFGAVTITKSITISAEGVEAGVLVSGTNGIIINAASTSVIVLRGLDIEGLGTGLNGIRFLAGQALHVENCTINNFTQNGIDVQPTSAGGNLARIFISNTAVRNNQTVNGGGIFIKPGAGISVSAALDHVRADRNFKYGIRAEDRSTVAINNSEFSGNSSNGVLAFSSGAAATQISLSNSIVHGTVTNGVSAQGSSLAVIFLTGSTVSGNTNGLATGGGGQIVSSGNNTVAGNTVNGSPTSTPGTV